MKIEEIEILLDKHFHSSPVLDSQRELDKVKSYINQLEADKLEMVKAIVDKCIQDEGDWGECIYCYEGGWGYPEKHKDDCIVNKANKYIKEVEK